MKRLLFFIFLALLSSHSYSQFNLQEFNKERSRNTKNGMIVLGSWSVANIGVGAVGMTTTEGEAKYFHQMNLIWGSVNLFIAAASYLGQRKQASDLSVAQSIKKQSSSEKYFLSMLRLILSI